MRQRPPPLPDRCRARLERNEGSRRAVPSRRSRRPPERAYADKFLILSTSLLTERMLIHTAFLDGLTARGTVTLWSTAHAAVELVIIRDVTKSVLLTYPNC